MDHTASFSVSPFVSLRRLAVPFRAIAGFWSSILLAQSRADAVQRLYAMEDDALAAKGLTRQGELARIFGD